MAKRKTYSRKKYSPTLKFNGKIFKLDTKKLLTGFGQSRKKQALKRKKELILDGYNVRLVTRKTLDGTNRILIYKRLIRNYKKLSKRQRKYALPF